MSRVNSSAFCCIFAAAILSASCGSEDNGPCNAANHCVLDTNGAATCEPGFEWQDADNYICVAVAGWSIASFDANPATVIEGDATAVTWSWSYSDVPTQGRQCSIDNDVGNVLDGDTSSVNLDTNTTFTLTCTDGFINESAQTTVSVVPAVAPILSTFTASPSAVEPDRATRITWAWTYANTPTPDPDCSIDNYVGEVPNGGNSSINIDSETTFTLTCANADGSDTEAVTISMSCRGRSQSCDESATCCSDFTCWEGTCADCGDVGGSCETENDCCSPLVCAGGQCIAGSCQPLQDTCADSSECCDTTPCNTGTCCNHEATHCSNHGDCCDGLNCNEYECRNEPADECGVIGNNCRDNNDCCDRWDFTCGSGECCLDIGINCENYSYGCCDGLTCMCVGLLGCNCCVPLRSYCESSSECCGTSVSCNDNTCCRNTSGLCDYGSQCCSGVCGINGLCQ